MNRFTKWLVPAAMTLGLTIVFCAVPGHAADSAAAAKPAARKVEGKGTISGTLVDKDGNAVSGARVSLVQPPGREAKREQKALRQQNAGEKPAKVAGEKTRPEPLATTTTDKDGKFTFKDVVAGDYTVRAQLRGQGMAVARVSVTAGNTADVAMTLKQGPGGGGARKTGAKPEPSPEKQAQREQRKQERKAEKKAAKSQV